MTTFLTSLRRAGATSVAALLGLAVLIGIAHANSPVWTEAAKRENWDVLAARNQAEAATKEGVDLDHEIDDSHRRLGLKEHLIDDLLAERASLKEVTDEFLTLNETQPAFMLVVRATYAGATDREKIARNVIDYALYRDKNALSHKIHLLARFANELQQLLHDPA